MPLNKLKKLLNFKNKSTDSIVAFVVIASLGYVFLKTATNLFLGSSTQEGLEVKGRKELLLLHMEGCPHCVSLMPEWKTAEKQNNTGISMRAVERSQGDGPQLCDKHNITGFPTILLVDNKGNKLQAYNGERNTAGLLNFMKLNK